MRKQKIKPRQRSSKKERYKVINWPEYNRSLKNRGNLKVWIPKNILESWYAEDKLIKEKGSPQDYSDLCIEACLTIKILFHLGYRQTEGFIESVFAMAKIELKVPSYSVICKRSKKIKVNLLSQHKKKTGDAGINVSIDSTGLKVYGEGEWKVRTHGWGKHRTWQKLHLAVNPDERTIVGCELTTNSIHDSHMVETLLKQVKEKIQTFQGDGAYDKVKVYDALATRKIKPVIPPQKGARIKKHGNKVGKINPRDRNIRIIRKVGRAEWKRKEKYHKRSIAETTMGRYKAIISDKLYSRTMDRQKTETIIACKILNKMIRAGKPESVKITVKNL